MISLPQTTSTPEALPRGVGLVERRRRVVVGDREEPQAHLGGQLRERGGREAPVGAVRVGVEVDQVHQGGPVGLAREEPRVVRPVGGAEGDADLAGRADQVARGIDGLERRDGHRDRDRDDLGAAQRHHAARSRPRPARGRRARRAASRARGRRGSGCRRAARARGSCCARRGRSARGELLRHLRRDAAEAVADGVACPCPSGTPARRRRGGRPRPRRRCRTGGRARTRERDARDDAVGVVRDLGQQDHVGAAGDAGVERDPARVAAHHLDAHHAVVARGRRVEAVERLASRRPRRCRSRT